MVSLIYTSAIDPAEPFEGFERNRDVTTRMSLVGFRTLTAICWEHRHPRGLTSTSPEPIVFGIRLSLMLGEATIRIAMRTTARVSFVLFLAAFLGDALYRLWPMTATRWIARGKGRFTLGFAASHTVHLMFILALVTLLGREHLVSELGWFVLISFTTGFLFIYALTVGVVLRHRRFWLTSPHFEAVAHYFLISLFAFAFALSALSRPIFYTPFVLTAITALGLRIVASARSKGRRKSNGLRGASGVTY